MNVNQPLPLPRKYSVTATARAHRKAPLVELDGCEVDSTHRIRFIVLHMWNHYFPGRKPYIWWGDDGFMGQAWDEVGNSVDVYQENHWAPFRPGATRMPRPLCPMVLKKAA